MRCPYCQHEDTQVKDSRPAEEGAAIRRRRVCSGCGGRFTTFERVQLRELLVSKKSGRCEPFDRDKLMRSVDVAVRKRNINLSHIERAISGIIRQLESSGESEISSERIGCLVMEALKGIDDIAYIRFASVYRDFCSASDFHDVIDELSKDITDTESRLYE
ncbi:transcriptional regulator NrdR [Bartonella sp. CB178]|uniref:transcriptional regulator NrdR n=1 Tax=Bartonella sp. CB178 TaxID=3112255 RepID=UPI00300E4228